MPFVKRDAEGKIVAAGPARVPGLDEEVSRADLVASGFLSELSGGYGGLVSSDLELLRVIEDLVDLLVDKGTILFRELPDSAQRKILERQQLRNRLGGFRTIPGDD